MYHFSQTIDIIYRIKLIIHVLQKSQSQVKLRHGMA